MGTCAVAPIPAVLLVGGATEGVVLPVEVSREGRRDRDPGVPCGVPPRAMFTGTPISGTSGWIPRPQTPCLGAVPGDHGIWTPHSREVHPGAPSLQSCWWEGPQRPVGSLEVSREGRRDRDPGVPCGVPPRAMFTGTPICATSEGRSQDLQGSGGVWGCPHGLVGIPAGLLEGPLGC